MSRENQSIATQHSQRNRLYGKTQEPQHVWTFKEYLFGCLSDIKKQGGKITFGNIINGVFIPVNVGEPCTIVRSKFEGKEARFKTILSFREEHDAYKAKFKVPEHKPSIEIPFEENAGIGQNVAA